MSDMNVLSVQDDNDDFIIVKCLRDSDRSVRHDFIHKVCRVFAAQLLGFSVFLMAIRWFEFTIHDYSNSWLLIFSLIVNSVFSMAGLWKKRHSQVYSIAFTVLFTCIWAYLVNLSIFSFYSYSPSNGCFIATGVFAAVTVFTMQTNYDIFEAPAAYFVGGCFFVFSAAAHLVLGYDSIGEYLGALAIGFFFTGYIMVGIYRSMGFFTANVQPNVSLAITVGLLHPFVAFLEIDDNKFYYE
ncbi:hypothetical protein GGI04_003274 [Coemansia thaxteri]|uniref:Uncharacterized protein n=1 Tax=Coemansia thaxteri TaxID=2663907 RepID=A0A9W8BFN5_9FUNG|nr:hypothetical protein GGI04_003274 [Coemansia thaxteri]KAJ2005967.1 hypothetical protein H4R26_001642 [Coemansia thaxteri]KAJ2466523.1 hypothetical protein GGI02_004341 [Coemansia sp. RSA 2322]KAJ2485152.1 hypothetical protein EV174_001907 [Coemansia sp. RSA 2320]